ncbi:hypothetical protein [Paenibacillus sp. BC26]|uniref:hypothetical protein n=1 Tax=Paenibacillus sp. BC26 TaxID=1881032 RepID=UPI0008EBB56D|nr:hypothetical protein [Paenibacillus sp. BC26]SFS76175.1 hypothetical protein SAMN05428962_2703 [Paenibacillus sp. BC26]
MKKQVIFGAFCLLVSFLIAGCQNDNSAERSSKLQHAANNNESNVSENTASVQNEFSKKQNSLHLSEYSGEDSKTILIHGKEEKGKWLYDGNSSFGFYFPPQIKIVKLREDNDYKTLNDDGRIAMIDENYSNIPDGLLQDPALPQ